MARNPVFINGQPGTGIDVTDRGLCYGHGVFETMRLSQGALPLWRYHRERLFIGLDALGIALSNDRLDRELGVALEAVPSEGVLKLVVTAGSGRRGYQLSAETLPTILIQWFPGVPPGGAIQLQRCRYRLPHNQVLAGVKHLNRLDQVLAARELEADRQGLLEDVNGHIIEGLSHNIFVKNRSGWVTPELYACGVRGVMRRLLMTEILPDLGFAVGETQLTLSDVLHSEEVFYCNAVAGVQPVTALDDHRWPRGEQSALIERYLKELYPCFIA